MRNKKTFHTHIHIGVLALLLAFSVEVGAKTTSTTDLLVVGGGASGVAASVKAARMGVKTLMVEETTWLGGMLTSAGVSAIDGNYNLRAGFWGEFLDSLVSHYGSYDALKTGWVSHVQFEPSVGDKILKEIVGKEKNITVVYEHYPKSIVRNSNGTWKLTATSDKGDELEVNARIVIDATELGDVAKMAGIGYDKGMEAKSVTGEEIAPEKANGIVQDLTYVATLKDYGRDMTIAKPANYDPNRYAGSCINDLCINPKEPDRMWPKDTMMTYGKLPNNKYMINWPIEGNDTYLDLIELTREQRIAELQKAKDITLGFVYFIQHELGFKNLGLADDEYPTADGLPMIPYHRESRRIHGLVRFNYNYAKDPYNQRYPLYRTDIAVGDYPVDHHHTKYSGYEDLPRLYFHPIPSYGLPLGTIIPQDVNNFIVAEKSISVSNIINGTTRLQPVVLQIGTAAGTLAAMAIQQGKLPQDISVRDVQNSILAGGGYLQPYIDVEKGSALFAPLQRVGSTGILKGVGKKVEWTNQFSLRADTMLMQSELAGLTEVYPYFKAKSQKGDKAVTIGEAMRIIKDIAQKEGIMKSKKCQERIESVFIKNFGAFNNKADILRGQYALLIDQVLDPFNRKHIDIYGNYLK